MKRFVFSVIILLSLEAAAAGAAEDVAADAARILRSTAEKLRTVYRAGDEEALYLFAGTAVGNEFEEFGILERLARSERGREIVGAACREAVAGNDPNLKLVAFKFLSDTEGAEATAAYLPDLYESISEDDVFMLVTMTEEALYRAPEELYARLARDLKSEDERVRLKAAKVLALSHTERARALVAAGMQSPDVEVRRLCVMNLAYGYDGFAESPADYGAVEAALADEDALVRGFAARRLGNTGDLKFLPPLLALLNDGEVSVRRAAASSVSALLGYAPPADESAARTLLRELKAETDGVTRCFLAEAYGAATTEEEGCGKYLTDDGYWAFFSGRWREKDLENYYAESGSGSWGGG